MQLCVCQVIREAWAHEECSHHKANQEKQERDWTISRQMVEYKDGEMALQGLYARPQGKGLRKKLPGVILAHTAVGPQEGIAPTHRDLGRADYQLGG